MTLSPGVTTDHVLALLGVAMGTLSSEDTALGPIALARARRGAHRFEPARTSPQVAAVPAASATPPTQSPAPPAPPPAPAPSGSPESVGPLHPSGGVFRLDALPPDVEAKRAIAALGSAASPEELVPFGGAQAHKAFALAVGLQLLVDSLAGPDHGAVLLVARPEHDPVPAFRQLAQGVRLPGDRA